MRGYTYGNVSSIVLAPFASEQVLRASANHAWPNHLFLFASFCPTNIWQGSVVFRSTTLITRSHHLSLMLISVDNPVPAVPDASSPILYCSPHVKFGDGKLVKTVKGWDDGLVLFAPAARKGLLYGKFKVISGVRTTIGVCESDVQRQGYLNKTSKGWGYYQATGRIGNGGPAQMDYGKRYREAGTIVEVEVDIAHGTVQYWLDGENQGYAFGDPKADTQRLPRLPPSKEYVIAISLFELAATVQYLGCKREPPGGDDSFPATGSARTRTSFRGPGTVVSPAAAVIDLAADEFAPPPISTLNTVLECSMYAA